MSIRYSVIFDPFSERHYIKKCKKKYSARVWEVLEEAIVSILQNPDVSIERRKLETISDTDNMLLAKLVDLKIPGKKGSGRKSQYRGIVVIDKKTKTSRLLLFYHKSDLIGSGGETAKWKKIIKNNFPEYKELVH